MPAIYERGAFDGIIFDSTVITDQLARVQKD